MWVRELLDVPDLRLRLLTDVTGMDRAIRHVYTTDLPDPSRYLTPGDLVLTGLIWCRASGDADRFVSALVRADLRACRGEALGGCRTRCSGRAGGRVFRCSRCRPETSFVAVTDEVARRLSGDRATEMTRVLGRRRLLLSAVAEGAGLDAMFRLMGRELGAECWLLTGLGRVIGGTGTSLPGPCRSRLACEYLKADRMPVATEVSVPGTGGGKYSLFGVGSEPRITRWFLACAGREQDWPHELRESVAELAADVALGTGQAGRRPHRRPQAGRGYRHDARVRGPARAPRRAQIASLMRAAALPPDGRYLVAVYAGRGGIGHGDRVRTPIRWRLRPAPGNWSCRTGREGTLVAPLGKKTEDRRAGPGWGRRLTNLDK